MPRVAAFEFAGTDEPPYAVTSRESKRAKLIPAHEESDSALLSTEVGSPVYQPARFGMVVAAA